MNEVKCALRGQINRSKGKNKMQATLRKRQWAILSLATAAALAGPAARAGTLYWDHDGSSTGNNINGANLGGSGAWNTTTSYWWSGTGADQTYISGSDDIFNGSLGTVTLAGATSANSLTFNTSGYVLTGGTLTNSTGVINETQGTANIASALTGSNGLTIDGGGFLSLSGTGTFAPTYSGTTTISSGALQVGATANLSTAPTLCWVTSTAPAIPSN